MKTNRSPGEAHRDKVNNLIDEHPAERTHQELERIRRDGHGVGKPDAISC